jgi:hypothetical protein
MDLNWINDLLVQAKDNLFEKLNEEIRKDDSYKKMIESVDNTLNNLIVFDNYIESQLEIITSKINEFETKFDLKKVKIESDIIILFDVINNTSNILLSSFSRNNLYYKRINKSKDYLIKVLSKIYTKEGVIALNDLKGRNRNQTIRLIEEDSSLRLLNDVLNKFEIFFDIYVQATDLLKNKGFLLKEYHNFLQYSKGNN